MKNKKITIPLLVCIILSYCLYNFSDIKNNTISFLGYDKYIPTYNIDKRQTDGFFDIHKNPLKHEIYNQKIETLKNKQKYEEYFLIFALPILIVLFFLTKNLFVNLTLFTIFNCLILFYGNYVSYFTISYLFYSLIYLIIYLTYFIVKNREMK